MVDNNDLPKDKIFEMWKNQDDKFSNEDKDSNDVYSLSSYWKEYNNICI